MQKEERFTSHAAEAARRNMGLAEGADRVSAIDVANEEADELNTRIGQLNSNYITPARDLAEYSPQAKAFIDRLSDEEFRELSLTYFYHVTNADCIDSIMQNGMGGGELQHLSDDFEFLEQMYSRYGDSYSRDFFYSLVMGANRHNDSRFSEYEPQIAAYQIPERLKFFLQNIKFLLTKDGIHDEERTKCQEIYGRYMEKFSDKENQVYVVGLSAASPYMLNAYADSISKLLAAGETNEDIIEIISGGSGDMSLGRVPAQYLKVLNIFDLDQDELDIALNGTTGICF